MQNTVIPGAQFGLGSYRKSLPNSSRAPKAQDRDGGEEIANNSVLNFGMKNAVLRS